MLNHSEAPLIKRPNESEHRPANCFRQIAPGSNDSPQISVNGGQFEPFRATKMHRPCSAALLANHPTTRQKLGCVRTESGLDQRHAMACQAHGEQQLQWSLPRRLSGPSTGHASRACSCSPDPGPAGSGDRVREV